MSRCRISPPASATTCSVYAATASDFILNLLVRPSRIADHQGSGMLHAPRISASATAAAKTIIAARRVIAVPRVGRPPA